MLVYNQLLDVSEKVHEAVLKVLVTEFPNTSVYKLFGVAQNAQNGALRGLNSLNEVHDLHK